MFPRLQLEIAMIDRYTKAMMTVIAISLVALVVQNLIPASNAQSGIQKVIICDPSDARNCAKLWPFRSGGNDTYGLQVAPTR
jgi:SNF family Na+-dependent transporter